MALEPLQRILLYVDATDSSLTAARYAIVLAKNYDAELHAVYVINERILEELLHARVFIDHEQSDLKHELEEDGNRYLNFIKKLSEAKGVPVQTELLRGMIQEEVIAKAEAWPADLVVMGEVEEPLTRRDCAYNEAQRILWTAKCPVLVVKGDKHIRVLYDDL